MELLEFARGPALAFSLGVFFVGIAWRLYGIFRRPRKTDFSVPRSTHLARGALRAIWVRMFPRREYGSPGLAATVNAYAYHIGIALVVFAFAPHIGFIKRLTGLHWPALPDAFTYIATAVAIVTLIIALVNRMTDGVLRLLSNFDDYFTWIVTMLPLATGMALIERPYVPAPRVYHQDEAGRGNRRREARLQLRQLPAHLRRQPGALQVGQEDRKPARARRRELVLAPPQILHAGTRRPGKQPDPGDRGKRRRAGCLR